MLDFGDEFGARHVRCAFSVLLMVYAVGISCPNRIVAQDNYRSRNSIGLAIGQAQQPAHKLFIEEGRASARAYFEMKHAFVSVHLRREIAQGWFIGIGASYFLSRAVTRVNGSVWDTSGTHSGSRVEDTGYLRNPFGWASRTTIPDDRYVPIQLAVGSGKFWNLNARLAIGVDGSVGIMPVHGVQIEAYGVKDPRDSTWNMLQATYETDGLLNPFGSVSVTARRSCSARWTVFLSGQFLSTFTPFYLRELEIVESSMSYRQVRDMQRFAWFAVSAGIEFSWGKPFEKRERPDHRGRAPYWPG